MIKCYISCLQHLECEDSSLLSVLADSKLIICWLDDDESDQTTNHVGLWETVTSL